MAGFLLRNGYVLLFAASLFEQLGAPLPSSPLLLGAGAFARSGDMALPQILALSIAASMLGHSAWFYAGRRRGGSVLRLLCRNAMRLIFPLFWWQRCRIVDRNINRQ